MKLGSTIQPQGVQTTSLRKFGLIGGTSWRSTLSFYEAINDAINLRHGNNTNPRLNLASLDQASIHAAQKRGDWEAILELFEAAALELQSTGVEGLAFCANTPHKIYDAVQSALRIPVLHIADGIGRECARREFRHIGWLGTRFSMEEDFLLGRLRHRHGLKASVPSEAARQAIHRCVVEKLSMGHFDDDSRNLLLDQVRQFAESGAEAVVLGCTEFPLLMDGGAAALPLIDSLACHCEQIVRFIAGDESPEA
ncbi:aspartate racemase [Haloferula helveola]|uniref:Aspartate racemase n=1 Tax=Haloferula helveola TaxID=490095 RepID=A0ABM7RFW1_9BACT|nr:aspartate racemase [Haloferula helveola]